ncbi:MAG: GTP-binding protein [Clostridium sp.]
MKRFVIGILAHVDAGKTTMSEAILYETGKLKKMGRVDNRDAFLDTFALERARAHDLAKQRSSVGDTSRHFLTRRTCGFGGDGATL